MSSDGSVTTYLVESYWPGVNEPALARASQRAREAASALRQRGADVELLGSILVPADETVFWLFSGREPDIRAASEQAGVPFARVLESLHEFGEKKKGDR
jgi:hypothetical protein